MVPATANIQPVLVSIGEAAKLLGIGRSTVYCLISDGDLKALKIGSRTVIRRSDADELVERLPLVSVRLSARDEHTPHARRDRTRPPAVRGRPPAVDRSRPRLRR
jgi:excisionase family DNA binding protein